MKIPNTLRQSGGADIKLKIKKLPGIVKVFLLVLFSFLFLYVLYYITDNLFNGSFRQWLSDRYTSANMTTDIYTGEMISSISVDWFQLKTDVLIGGALLICFFVLAVHFSVCLADRGSRDTWNPLGSVSDIEEKSSGGICSVPGYRDHSNDLFHMRGNIRERQDTCQDQQGDKDSHAFWLFQADHSPPP